MKILAFAASLREGSYNRKLITVAAGMLRELGGEVDLAPFSDFDMPLYNYDRQTADGFPPGAEALKRRIEAVPAIVMAVPEYNYSIPGILKNAIDWVSRARPMPWRGRSVYLLSASPGSIGGIRGLWQTRIPLEGCGSMVFPDMFALPYADKAFTADGALADAATADRLRQQVVGFYRLAEALEPICCGESGKKEITRALEDETRIQPPSKAGAA